MSKGKYNFKGFGVNIKNASFGVFILFLLLVAPAFFLASVWIFMILIGVLHSVVPQVPAFGFWKSGIIYIVLSIIAGLFKR